MKIGLYKRITNMCKIPEEFLQGQNSIWMQRWEVSFMTTLLYSQHDDFVCVELAMDFELTDTV